MTDLLRTDFRGNLVFRAVKRNKRMVIVLERSPKMVPISGMGKYLDGKHDVVVYTPPDFLRGKIRSRREMEELASRLNECSPEDRIGVIMEFETGMRGLG